MEIKFVKASEAVEHSEALKEILEKSKANVEAKAAAAGIVLPPKVETTTTQEEK